MSLKTISRWLVAFGCVAALPLYAQTTATTTTSTSTKTTTHVTHKAKTEVKETKAEEKKETKVEEKKEATTEKHEMKMAHHARHTAASGRLVDDSTRLAAILDDSQTKIAVSGAVLKTTANEANTLVNRVYASARSASEKKAAREARTHIREMRSAAMKGDDAGAKSHAGMALPYVYQVIDAATK